MNEHSSSTAMILAYDIDRSDMLFDIELFVEILMLLADKEAFTNVHSFLLIQRLMKIRCPTAPDHEIAQLIEMRLGFEHARINLRGSKTVFPQNILHREYDSPSQFFVTFTWRIERLISNFELFLGYVKTVYMNWVVFWCGKSDRLTSQEKRVYNLPLCIYPCVLIIHPVAFSIPKDDRPSCLMETVLTQKLLKI